MNVNTDTGAVDTDLEWSESLRLLDANANRAAEGLRTIEDIARLIREDRAAAEWAKVLRHRLAAVCQGIPRQERLRSRSVATDAGTQITLSSEQLRTDWNGVVSAATERVSQSLRGLEEFSKFRFPLLAEEFKQLRYQAYDTLAAIELRLHSGLPVLTGRMILLIDCSKDLDSFVAYVRELSAIGIEYFQLRDKLADGAKLMKFARAAIHHLRGTNSHLLINDRVDIALASGAVGVHVGQEDMGLADVQQISRGKLLIGVSTHNLQQALDAQRAGADYIGCGPTFASTTKQFDSFAGLSFLQQISESIRIPAFAIGGVDVTNLSQVVHAGIHRIAVSGAIHQAKDPSHTARQLLAALG